MNDFLEGIPKVEHTSLEIVIKTIENLKLNISDCRGQSYRVCPKRNVSKAVKRKYIYHIGILR